MNGKQMAIDPEMFLRWAEDRFDNDVKTDNKGNIRLNSIFADDYKHHMYCHVDPQIKDGSDRPFGTYHCFKTDKRGTLVSLVMQIDSCAFDEALNILGGEDSNMRLLEERLQQLLHKKPSEPVIEPSPVLQIPSGSHPILNLPESDYYRSSAEIYLTDRKLSPDKYLVCISGKYKNRIIIPYYDRDGKLIYWNSRVIGDSHGKNVLRYQGPDSEVGVGKSDVVYTSCWPELGEEIFITEGEFDADSLASIGLNGIALGGKVLSPSQAEYLRGYKVNICLDNDGAGEEAIQKVGNDFIERGFSKGLSFVRPPVGYKDWNSMLIKLKPDVIRSYIITNRKPYSPDTGLIEKIKHFAAEAKNFRPTKAL